MKTRSYWLSRVTFVASFVISVTLIVAGFFVPPMGIIDGSVITAVGELILFPTLLYGFRAIELGMWVRFQRGDVTVDINPANDTTPANEEQQETN